MSTEIAKNVVDTTVVGFALLGWHFNWPDLAAMAAILYTITRLIIEWPNLKTAVYKWFK